jgi:ribosome-associated translation inhibitor RaiA
MEFVYNLSQVNMENGLKEKFEKRLHGLKRAIKTVGHFEKKGDIIIDKLPRGQYLARIYIHLPVHHIKTEAKGYSPFSTLHKAADRAKSQIIDQRHRK